MIPTFNSVKKPFYFVCPSLSVSLTPVTLTEIFTSKKSSFDTWRLVSSWLFTSGCSPEHLQSLKLVSEVHICPVYSCHEAVFHMNRNQKRS